MYGLIGVAAYVDATQALVEGLNDIQHRGQKSFGVALGRGVQSPQVVHRSGQVDDSFADLLKLEGRTGIGAVSSNDNGQQPIAAAWQNRGLAAVCDGRFTNYERLHEELDERGSVLDFRGNNHAGVWLHLVATAPVPTLDEKILMATNQIEGGFAGVIMAASEHEEVLYLACDGLGHRPLVYGLVPGLGWVAASETGALQTLGATSTRYVRNGAVIKLVAKGQDGCVAQQLRKGHNSGQRGCKYEYMYLARPDSIIDGVSVDSVRHRLGHALARVHPVARDEVDYVFSVPDSSNSAALGFADESGVPFKHGILRNHHLPRGSFESTSIANLRRKYKLVRELCEGRSVVIVEDNVLRGDTVKGLVAMLKEAGVIAMHLRVMAPPIISGCRYGVDSPETDKLIAPKMSVEEMARHFGVTSIGFLGQEHHVNINVDLARACGECLKPAT